MKTLSVSADYSRYGDDGAFSLRKGGLLLDNHADVKHTLSVDRGRRPGVAFLNKMMQ
jgi:hypothetical protein